MGTAKCAMKRVRIHRWEGEFTMARLKSRSEGDTIIVNPSRIIHIT